MSSLPSRGGGRASTPAQGRSFCAVQHPGSSISSTRRRTPARAIGDSTVALRVASGRRGESDERPSVHISMSSTFYLWCYVDASRRRERLNAALAAARCVKCAAEARSFLERREWQKVQCFDPMVGFD